jgi:Protein kinase domain
MADEMPLGRSARRDLAPGTIGLPDPWQATPSAAPFPTTCWSRVVTAGDPAAPESRAALAELCAAYWYPIYALIRRRGHPAEEARDLAVKVLLEAHRDKPDLIRRFVEEAQIGGQLQHPGIVPIYELGTFADRRPCFAMKLVKGQTLAALLAGRSSPADGLPRFLGIFEQVCQTVAYAHARGVIHRDLKPSNVMVGSFGEVQRKAAQGDTADAFGRLDACGAEAELTSLAKASLAREPADRPRDARAVADRMTAYLVGVQERLHAAERERAVAETRATEERRKRRWLPIHAIRPTASSWATITGTCSWPPAACATTRWPPRRRRAWLIWRPATRGSRCWMRGWPRCSADRTRRTTRSD